MKKVMTALLAICLGLALSACGNGGVERKTVEADNQDQSKNLEKAESTKATKLSKSEAAESNEANSQADLETDSTKTLVVYFSCTGHTKKIAEYVADGLEADLYEIVPLEPYTEEDLNYNDDASRTTKEMNDDAARPAISESVENMDQYDTVFLGYPIWWGKAPRIMDTFVESYDFTDKTVIPFCTSGSSDIGSSAETLKSLAGSGDWKEGKRFSGSESEADMMAWVNQLELD